MGRANPRFTGWVESISAGHPGSLRVMLEALEMFAANDVSEDAACLYLLLLSSRGYVGERLFNLYTRAGSSAARMLNMVADEATEELIRPDVLRSHSVTVSSGLASRAVTDSRGRYLGAINELADGRFEALVVGEANDIEPSFATWAAAEEHLRGAL